ncbi:MAG TPA: 6-carboxytetrahydropterin synthase [Alphaproteobacteria bacterium]|jgi:6-pyruvoyltetrahydropterin/6-carboxytetrahydropterin synthase
MTLELSQSFYFEAAHTLRRAVDAAGSLRVHGHTYLGEVAVVGPKDAASGMVVDLAQLRAVIERTKQRLDHHMLNEVEGLGVPTLENLCEFLWRSVAAEIPNVVRVRVSRAASGDSCSLTQAP